MDKSVIKDTGSAVENEKFNGSLLKNKPMNIIAIIGKILATIKIFCTVEPSFTPKN
jgi:hypothetical protein